MACKAVIVGRVCHEHFDIDPTQFNDRSFPRVLEAQLNFAIGRLNAALKGFEKVY